MSKRKVAPVLTVAQRQFLEFISDCPRRGWDGGIAKGSREPMAALLARAGLCRYLGRAYEEDGNPDMDWPCYEITDAGRAALARVPGRKA